jgi:hypothetical protein
MSEYEHNRVPFPEYAWALSRAWDTRPEVSASVTDYRDAAMIYDGAAYLAADRQSGFLISGTGELAGVFSTMRGRGDSIMRDALHYGATHLDCFDGYLPTFYARHGFRETRRVPNWAPSGPDVVYMALSTDRVDPAVHPDSPEAWAKALADLAEAADTGPSDFEDSATIKATAIRAALEAELDAALEEGDGLIDAIMSVIERVI